MARYRCSHGRSCEVPSDCPDCAEGRAPAEPRGLERASPPRRASAPLWAAAALLAGLVAAFVLDQALGSRRARAAPRPWTRPATPTTATAALGLEWVPSGAGTLELSRSEVTVAQYRGCVAVERCRPPLVGHYCPRLDGPPNLPAACVSAGDAATFCQHLGARLPTAEEWRAAASAGADLLHPWGDAPATCARAVTALNAASPGTTQALDGCRRVGPVEVCLHPEGDSPWRACDLIGNVAEWVTEGERTLAAGGSWGTTATAALSARAQEAVHPDYRADNIGFRCVRGALTR